MPTFCTATLAAPGGGREAVTVIHRERMVTMNSKVLACVSGIGHYSPL